MKLNTILAIIFTSLLVFIITVTAISLTSGKSQPRKDLISNQNTAVANKTEFSSSYKKKTTFTNLGQLRTSTKPDKDGKVKLVIVTPYLEYFDNDTDFYEELDAKTKKIRSIITGYLSSLTFSQINETGEEAINQTLLKKINSILVLQKIQNLYFMDFQFL